MRSKLWVLLKNQYLNQSNLNAWKHEKDKKRKHRMIGMYAALTIVFVMIIVYSFLIAYGYGYLGMVNVIPGYTGRNHGIWRIIRGDCDTRSI